MKLNGLKTYASVIVTVIAVAILKYQGADIETLVAVGIAGLSSGAAGLRHAMSKPQKIDAAEIASLIEKHIGSETSPGAS